jgi:hypothetical protein
MLLKDAHRVLLQNQEKRRVGDGGFSRNSAGRESSRLSASPPTDRQPRLIASRAHGTHLLRQQHRKQQLFSLDASPVPLSHRASCRALFPLPRLCRVHPLRRCKCAMGRARRTPPNSSWPQPILIFACPLSLTTPSITTTAGRRQSSSSRPSAAPPAELSSPTKFIIVNAPPPNSSRAQLRLVLVLLLSPFAAPPIA